MGLNWSEGLRAGAQGLQTLAGAVNRREESEIERLRQENMAQLQHRLAMERDAVNNQQAIDREDRAYGRQKELIEIQDTRAAERESRADARLSRREAAADGRADDRFAREMEINARRGNENRIDQWTEAFNQAQKDLMDTQQAIQKLQSGDLSLMDDQSKAERKSQIDALSFTLEDAQRRKVMAERQLRVWNRRVAPDFATEGRTDKPPSPFASDPQTGLIPIPQGLRARQPNQ
jgi:hypothetical protein